jgi:translation initiation factor 2B subunit (eIF-2B alpha/beta/delta family)
MEFFKSKSRDSFALAKRTISSLHKVVSAARNSNELYKKLQEVKEIVLNTATDPFVKNAINYITHKLPRGNLHIIKSEINKRIFHASEHISYSNNKIAHIGYKKIKKGMNVFVCGNSSSVLYLLLRAKQEGTNFEVHTTETRPSFAGKSLSVELTKHKIPVKIYSDLALRQALKKADLVLLGADAFSPSGQIYGCIGSELAAETAERYDIPIYVCADSWKFDRNIRYLNENLEKNYKEIWPNPPKGAIVMNYVYEKVHPKLISGIITEFGIFKPHYLLSEIRKMHTWA